MPSGNGRPPRVDVEIGDERETGETGSHVRLLVSNNGSGFASGASTGIGLTAMRERVLSIEGSSDIESSPAEAVISVSLPLCPDARDAPCADRYAVEGAIE